MIKVNCDLCGSMDFKELYTFDLQILVKDKQYKTTVTNGICLKCGLVFQNPRPTEREMVRFYENQFGDPRLFLETKKMGSRSRLNQAIFIEKHLLSSGRHVLDIGSSDGYFLHLLKEKGWKVLGIDISKKAAQFAKTKYGIYTIIGSFEKCNLKDKFDLITIRNTLEHVYRPAKVLKLINRKLKKDGFLFIEVPNLLSARVESIADYFGFQHLTTFSPNTISALLKKTGFKVIIISTNTGYQGMHILAQKNPGKVDEEFSFKINHDVKTAIRFINEYKIAKKYFLHKITTKINSVINISHKGRGLLIFGAGEHSAQLFEQTKISRANIIGFIDNSREKWGKKILGYNIYSPNDLLKLSANVILISSYDSQNAIYQQLQKFSGLKSRIIKLYSKIISYES